MLLITLGITEEEMSFASTSNNRLSVTLKQQIADLKSDFENTSKERDEQSVGFNDLKREVEVLREQATMNQNEIEHLKSHQIHIEGILDQKTEEQQKLMEASERQLKDHKIQFDNEVLQTQMAITAKQQSEQKLDTVNEQKKILIKEVKQLRKQNDLLTKEKENLAQKEKELNQQIRGFLSSPGENVNAK